MLSPDLPGSMEPKRPVGRPAGPVDPIDQHERELLGWIKVNTRIRKLVETQLTYLEKKLSNADTGNVGVQLDDMLTVMQALGTLLTVSTKTVEAGFKALDRPGGGASSKDETDPDRISELLEGGRGA